MKKMLMTAAIAVLVSAGAASAQTVTFSGPRLPFEFNNDAAGTGYSFTCDYATASTFRVYQDGGRYTIIGFTDNPTRAQVEERLKTGVHPTNFCMAGAGPRQTWVTPESIRFIVKVAG